MRFVKNAKYYVIDDINCFNKVFSYYKLITYTYIAINNIIACTYVYSSC